MNGCKKLFIWLIRRFILWVSALWKQCLNFFFRFFNAKYSYEWYYIHLFKESKENLLFGFLVFFSQLTFLTYFYTLYFLTRCCYRLLFPAFSGGCYWAFWVFHQFYFSKNEILFFITFWSILLSQKIYGNNTIFS